MKVCDICGYEAKHQGALNMHKYHCKIKNQNRENVSHETKVEKEVEKECNHNYRLLNGSIAIENRAIKNGYTEVCTICQSVQ